MRELRETLRQFRRIRRLLRRDLPLILFLTLFLLFPCLCVFPSCALWGAADRTLRDAGILPTRTPTPVPVETPSAFEPPSESIVRWHR